MQFVPQLVIPPSSELTVPLPVPTLLTATARLKRCRAKLAVTDRAALIVTVQDVPETVSQPLQPPKLEPEAGLAVRVVRVPLS